MVFTTNGSTSVALNSGELFRATITGNAIVISSVNNTAFFENDAIVEYTDVDIGKFATSDLKIVVTKTLNGGILNIYTATSSDRMTYSSYVAIAADGTVQSPFGQYLKIKLEFIATRTSSNTTVNNFVSSESAQFDNPNVTFDGSAYVSLTKTLTATQDTSYTDSGSLYRVTIDTTTFKTFFGLVVN